MVAWVLVDEPASALIRTHDHAKDPRSSEQGSELEVVLIDLIDVNTKLPLLSK